MLHITNGDSAAEIIQYAVFSGQILSWKDVLHEGPVPAGLYLQQLSKQRARYIGSLHWGEPALIEQMFAQRDETLERFREHDEIVLWFEHDLYDQLQLIQILDWFYERQRGATKLSLICIGAHPEIPDFRGLGQLSVQQMAGLLTTRHAVTPKELKTAHLAWQAYCATDPTNLAALLQKDLSALPFLKNAMRRQLQQFPSTHNGLGRSEQQILTAIAAGNHTPKAIFQADQKQEEAVFMGDATFWIYLHRLCQGNHPLLTTRSGADFFIGDDESEVFHQQELVLTAMGEKVLDGKEDQIARNGINRWFGGIHLQAGRQVWRWDHQDEMLIKDETTTKT